MEEYIRGKCKKKKKERKKGRFYSVWVMPLDVSSKHNTGCTMHKLRNVTVLPEGLFWP